MPAISVTDADKKRFVQLKPDEQTHKEFFADVLHTYEHAEETVEIDTDAIVEQISKQVSAEVELSAYRGVQEGLEQHD